MTRPARWWQTGECSIQAEEQLFADASLGFVLDQQVLDSMDVVVFRGQLRYGERRWNAWVEYPPGYASGYQPLVYAPGLSLPRHIGRDGLLCLDHPTLGTRAPMSGAEAVQRAEQLWRLSCEDPDALRGLEAAAPEPAIETYLFEPDSVVYLIGADVTGHNHGWIGLAATSNEPFRAALAGLGADHPAEADFRVVDANQVFRGETSVCGYWQRIDAPPPGPGTGEIGPWLVREHPDLVHRAQNFALSHTEITRTRVPALIGLVFPDEGPKRDEYHDEWLLVVIEHDGRARLPRPAVIHATDQFTRQPQLRALAGKRVAVIGTGALGSQIAALLARAGVGSFWLIDPDVVTAGIVIRHQLDLRSLGRTKVDALANQLRAINPYINVTALPARYGRTSQRDDDFITDLLGTCDLIVNATAHVDTGFHISRAADALERPALHVAVSSGAYAGRVLLQRHGHSGCLECQARHQDEPVASSPDIPEWSEDPAMPEVMDRGCAQATFTGPGFELAEVAAAATRVATGHLLAGQGYPHPDFDLATLDLRDLSQARPENTYITMGRHPLCESCSA
jgi:molybdopterin/thiamine biosynthesis adenylyltransferase